MTSLSKRFLWNSNANLPKTYWISFWSDIRGLKSKVGKLTKNYEGKMDITSLWSWSLTQGHKFQKGSSDCSKQLFSEARVKIGVAVWSTFCSQTDTHTHKHTHRQTNWSKDITPPRFRGGVKTRWVIVIFYNEGIQLYAAHSGGWCSDLTWEEAQHRPTYLWHSGTTYLPKEIYLNALDSQEWWISVLQFTFSQHQLFRNHFRWNARISVLMPRFIVSFKKIELHKKLIDHR